MQMKDLAVTEIVLNHIWAPDFFGPQEIWSPRNMVPRNLGPALFWSPRNLVPEKFGPWEIWSPGNLVPGKFGPQEIWSPRNLVPRKNGPHKNLPNMKEIKSEWSYLNICTSGWIIQVIEAKKRIEGYLWYKNWAGEQGRKLVKSGSNKKNFNSAKNRSGSCQSETRREI
jgi:hypothetical protein